MEDTFILSPYESYESDHLTKRVIIKEKKKRTRHIWNFVRSYDDENEAKDNINKDENWSKLNFYYTEPGKKVNFICNVNKKNCKKKCI